MNSKILAFTALLIVKTVVFLLRMFPDTRLENWLIIRLQIWEKEPRQTLWHEISYQVEEDSRLFLGYARCQTCGLILWDGEVHPECQMPMEPKFVFVRCATCGWIGWTIYNAKFPMANPQLEIDLYQAHDRLNPGCPEGRLESIPTPSLLEQVPSENIKPIRLTWVCDQCHWAGWIHAWPKDLVSQMTARETLAWQHKHDRPDCKLADAAFPYQKEVSP